MIRSMPLSMDIDGVQPGTNSPLHGAISRHGGDVPSSRTVIFPLPILSNLATSSSAEMLRWELTE